MKNILVTLLSSCILAFATNTYAQQTTMQEGLALKYLVQQPTERSEHPPVIILLHGYGSDEKDLFQLRNFFPKNYLIVAPRAVYKLPHGGYEWYEMTDTNGVVDGNIKQLANSRKQIEKFITEVIAKYNADPKDVYLIGFSQGAIMSYQVGLTAPSMLKGIGALSGMIFPSLKPLVKRSAALKQLRIFSAHGTVDERISFQDGQSAWNYLQSLKLKPETHKYPGMGHTISKDVLSDVNKWLK